MAAGEPMATGKTKELHAMTTLPKLQRPRPRRPGLTLLELIVVLVILVAVAGILIPLMPNMLGRAHTSVGATNASEVNRMMQVYYQLNEQYPNVLDNLVASSTSTGGGTTNAVLSYLPVYIPSGSTTSPLQAYPLQSIDVTALTAAGITQVASLNDPLPAGQTPAATPTFNPYVYSSGIVTTQPIAANLNVASLPAAYVEGPTGLVKLAPAQQGGVYVVFGFGKQTTAIGKVVTDAPVHFGEFATDNASNVYCRYGLVFRTQIGSGYTTGAGGAVTAVGATVLPYATFVGAVSFQTNGIYGADGQLADYYDRVKRQD